MRHKTHPSFVPFVALLWAASFFWAMYLGTKWKHDDYRPKYVYHIAPLPLNRGIQVCSKHHQLDAITWVYQTGFDSTAWLFQCKDAGIYTLIGDRVWPPQ
jgi:hypothetical protein